MRNQIIESAHDGRHAFLQQSVSDQSKAWKIRKFSRGGVTKPAIGQI